MIYVFVWNSTNVEAITLQFYLFFLCWHKLLVLLFIRFIIFYNTYKIRYKEISYLSCGKGDIGRFELTVSMVSNTGGQGVLSYCFTYMKRSMTVDNSKEVYLQTRYTATGSRIIFKSHVLRDYRCGIRDYYYLHIRDLREGIFLPFQNSIGRNTKDFLWCLIRNSSPIYSIYINVEAIFK